MKAIKNKFMMTSLLLVLACGTEELEEVNLQDAALPDARPIALGSGGTSLSLTENEDSCERYGELGVFGIPLGLACHTAPLVGHMLYGDHDDRDGDGSL